MQAVNHVSVATASALGVSLFVLKAPFFLPFLFLVTLAGVLPDIDHPKSELGKITVLPAKILKHRGVTHSLVGLAFTTLGFWYASQGDYVWMRYLVLVAGWIGFGILSQRTLGILRRIGKETNILPYEKTLFQIVSIVLHASFVLMLLLIWQETLYQEILTLLFVGYLSHLVADFVTIEGIPLFWPLKRKYGLRLFKTGGRIEQLIGTLLIGVNLYLLVLFIRNFEVWEYAYWRIYVETLQ